MTKLELELNEYRYTLGKQGMLSMYDADGYLVVRTDAQELLDTPAGAFGREGWRMVQDDELEELMAWIEHRIYKINKEIK